MKKQLQLVSGTGVKLNPIFWRMFLENYFDFCPDVTGIECCGDNRYILKIERVFRESVFNFDFHDIAFYLSTCLHWLKLESYGILGTNRKFRFYAIFLL